MRDIRDDIRERLAAVEHKRQDFLAALKAQDDIKAALEKLLELEEARTRSGTVVNGNNHEKTPTIPVADFLVGLLRERPRTKEELSELAARAGYYPDAEAVGRAIHMTIVNMERSGRIHEVRGRYEEVVRD